MALSIGVRFPHRQYHGTPWDSAVNTGTVEWPPSPWRIVRALLSMWHTRFPDVSSECLERIVTQMGEPPTFLLPPVRHGHTRHYMPDLDHRSGEQGGTTLTLAPYLTVDPDEEVVVTWPGAELEDQDRELLHKLVDSLPYLGRAESVCEARLLTDQPEPEGREVLVPDPLGGHRLMCLEPSVTLAQLEVAPSQMRRGKRLFPQGAVWVSYPSVDIHAPPRPRRVSTPDPVEAIRWRVVTPAPFLAEFGILATERVRSRVVAPMRSHDSPEHRLIHGHGADSTPPGQQHRHAHWLWTEQDDGRRKLVHDVVLWVPAGVPGELLTQVLQRASLSRPQGYSPRGFTPGQLHMVAAGSAEHVMPDLGAARASRRWRSDTPYLMSLRMRKRRTWLELIQQDLERELRFRFGDDAPKFELVATPDGQGPRSYRRYRWKHDRSHTRAGWNLDIRFDRDVSGPLLLGGLCHFGFGRFSPVGENHG